MAAQYRALVSFTGKISMSRDQVREISDRDIVKDLLNAGYVEEVAKTTPKKEAKKK